MNSDHSNDRHTWACIASENLLSSSRLWLTSHTMLNFRLERPTWHKKRYVYANTFELQLITEPKARTENFLIWMDFEFIDRFSHNSLSSDSITLKPIPLIRDNLSAISGQEQMAKICFHLSCGTGDLLSLQHFIAGWAVTQTCWIFGREDVNVLWRRL